MAEDKESLINRVLRFFKEVVPWVSVAASWVYNFMLRKIDQAEKQRDAAELEGQYAKNDLETELEHAGRDPSDVIRDAVNEGRGISESRLKKPGGEDSNGSEQPDSE